MKNKILVHFKLNAYTQLVFIFRIISSFSSIFLFNIFSWSASYQGIISLDKNKNHTLYDHEQKITYVLNYKNNVTFQQIKRLSSGDFASFTGDIDPTYPNLLHVNSLDYIGLNILIGLWRSDDYLCYNFVGFNHFYVFPESYFNKCKNNDIQLNINTNFRFIFQNSLTKSQIQIMGTLPTIPYAQKFSYLINPDVTAWTMLISSSSQEYFGDLQILEKNKIEIKLFDGQTGDILRKIILRR